MPDGETQNPTTESGTTNGAPDQQPPAESTSKLDVDTAKAFLMAQGMQVVPDSEFKSIKEKAAKKASAPLQAELDRLKDEHLQAIKRLDEIDNEGKSELQRYKEREKAWQESDQTKEARITELEKQISDREAALMATARDKILEKIVAPNALDSDVALLWARERMPGFDRFSVKDGQLIYQEPTGNEVVGAPAEKYFKVWWDGEKQLHRQANPPGPPTQGSEPAVSQGEEYKSLPPETPLEDRLAHAEAWERKQAAKNRQ